MKMTPKIHFNDAIPDGILAGFSSDGRVIVCIEFGPVYQFLFGSLADNMRVTEWNVCAAHARRIAMTAAWTAGGHFVVGNA